MLWARLTIGLLLLPYTTAATAQPVTPKIPLDSLGQFPILQLFGGILTILIPVMAWLLYLKAAYFKGKPAEPISVDVSGVKIDAANVMFYQGPLRAIFDLLTDIRGRQSLSRLEVRDDFAGLLSASRNTLADNVGTMITDLEARQENRFRDLRDNINSVHTRIDGVNENLIRIDTILDNRGRK